MSKELIDLARGIVNTSGAGHIYPGFAVRALEDEIERLGIQRAYVYALFCQIMPNAAPISSTWLFIRATPEQRARAFLKAIGHDYQG